LGTESDDLDMLAAAFLAGEGKKQVEIANTLSLSPTAVSRLLKEARKTYLRQEVRFLHEKLAPETMKNVLHRASRNQLGDTLNRLALRNGVRGPVLRVYSCHSPSKDIRQRMEELSRYAAPYIRDLILRAKVCGVTWGGMLSRVVPALRELSLASPWKTDRIDIIPLSGEPLGDNPNSYSSSTLAHELGRIVNGDEYNAESVAMVPAFIPDGFTSQEVQGVWRLIGLVKSYNRIFGPPQGRASTIVDRSAGLNDNSLANSLDMVLTSVGSAERPLGHGAGRLFETGGLRIEQLRTLVIGDIGGVCYPRPDLSTEEKEALRGVTSRWTGVSRRHLRGCARRAHEGDPFRSAPGVVVICVGSERAKFLIDVVKLGVVNHLIIDDDLQNALLRELNTSPRSEEGDTDFDG
jgi:DNA-binding transcriptional regulator LsrR (DeoR family)